MRRTTLLVLVSGVTLGLVAAAGTRLDATERVSTDEDRSMVIHVSKSTDDLHAAQMALKLGTIMSQRGADVTLMLDLEGVRLVDKRISQDLRWRGTTTMAERWRNFVAAGGSAMVCPHCAEVAGLTSSHLQDGATIATEAGLAELLMEADSILDY